MKKLIVIVLACLFHIASMAQTTKPSPPPPPPVPPAPPQAPIPPTIEAVQFTPPKIVKDTKEPKAPTPALNNKGYAISVSSSLEKTQVIVKKKSFKRIIPIEEWLANEKAYENKYGKLPPPPPPPPPPPTMND